MTDIPAGMVAAPKAVEDMREAAALSRLLEAVDELLAQSVETEPPLGSTMVKLSAARAAPLPATTQPIGGEGVTQADRDAAADLLATGFRAGEPGMFRDGWEDSSYVVQAFRDHRLAALRSTPPVPLTGDQP